ncbi:MAG TPA: iron-containing alcohol dehydrogenase [Bryobacteraceae bacterium]|jgi:alcohol dehydrogenase class IV|nr:iron-containing alcohol dehydrogenase [Bryobacteraceae bacterium]
MEAIFDTPSRILFGAGSRFRLSDELRRISVSRTLLVADQRLRDAGIIQDFEERLKGSGVEATVFADVQPDPTDVNVAAGLACLRTCKAEAIVAVGGGSVIDAAKVIGVASTNAQPISAFQGYGNIPNRGLPLIVIPTTAGTGSEATKAAVITDTQRMVKMMMLDANLMPSVSIVDYELTLTMPANLTAHVGVDTLVHGMEAFVSKRSNGMTDPLALSCIRLTAHHLLTAFREPDNRRAREAMALAACQGGMAFSNSSVCLVHGMSRPIGAIFHLPHGLSNAVLLTAVTRFSLPGAPARYARISREIGFCESGVTDEHACAVLVEGLENLNAQLGIPKLRNALKVDRTAFESHLRKMADDALASGSPENNPVVPAADEIIELYRQAW